MTANLLSSEAARKCGVFSMYERVDVLTVYNRHIIVELLSEIKCLKTLRVR